MFKSFFPNPKWFFISVVVYSAICSTIWYSFNVQIGGLFGFNLADTEPVIGLGHFVTDSFLLFYLYYFVCAALFAVFWFKFSPCKWQWWSISSSTTPRPRGEPPTSKPADA